MLYSTKDMSSCGVRAHDGVFGHVHDLVFDDRGWSIRYLVVDMESWLPGKRALIPIEKLEANDSDRSSLGVDLTRDEIEHSPGTQTSLPLAHDARSRYYPSYVWTRYSWGGFVCDVATDGPASMPPASMPKVVPYPPDNHLRSTREITGYRVQGEDGPLGQIEDVFFARRDWTVHYVVVDTGEWLPGTKVVVSPREIVHMEWADGRALVDTTKEAIKRAAHQQSAVSSRALSGPRLLATA